MSTKEISYTEAPPSGDLQPAATNVINADRKTIGLKPISPVGPAPEMHNEFPDGGRTAWTTVAGGWCAMFVSLGWNNSVGIFQTIYEEDLLKDYSPSVIGWILSFQTFLMFASAPICGKVFDNYGSRYLIISGTILHVLGVMTISLSTQYYQFILAQSICTGLGASAIFFSTSSSISTWFKKRRALALGISSSGSATGGVVVP